MEKLLKYLFAPLFAVLALTAVIYFFFKSLIVTSVPKYEGEIHLAGLTGNVEVRTGESGIPFISAGSRKDLVFALGYLHARDRLLEMEYHRLVCEGRLSEYFGKSAVEIDTYFRQFRLRQRAREQAGELNAEAAVLLKAYTDGVNGFLSSDGAVLQSEFAALGITPGKWEPKDILMLAMFNNYVEENKYVTQDIMAMVKKKIGPNRSAVVFGTEADSMAFARLPEIDEKNLIRETGIRKITGGSSSTGLSIAGIEGTNGVMLNIQGPFTFPGRFYNVTFEAEGRKGSVATIPGLPVVFAGLIGDEFFALKPAVKDIRISRKLALDEKDYILEKGALTRLKTVRDTIRIKDEQPLVIDLKTGPDGTVYTSFSKPELRYNRDSTEQYKVVTATSIVASSFDAAAFLQSGLELTQGNFASRFFTASANTDIWFKKGTGQLTKNSPRESVTDDEKPTAKKPKTERKQKRETRPKPKPAEESETPEPVQQTRIIEAATGINDGFFRGLVAPKERTYLLSPEGKDLPTYVVNDVISDLDLKLVPFILNAFNQPGGQKDTLVSQSLKIISRWSGEYLSSLQAPLIMATFLKYFTVNTFGDELSREDLLLLLESGGIPAARISQVIEENYSPVFDLRTTPNPENRDEIIRKSFGEAIRDIAGGLGEDPVMWLWGKENLIAPGHFLSGFLGGLNNAISIEKAGISGSFSTRFAAFTNPFSSDEGKGSRNSWGTLLRFYIDPAKGVFRMVPYLGNSGNFADKNSIITYEAFLEGKLVSVTPEKGNNDKVLRLIKKL